MSELTELENELVEAAIRWVGDGTPKSVNGNGLEVIGLAYALLDRRAAQGRTG